MRILSAFLFLALLTPGLSTAQVGGVSIAIVDLELAISSTAEGKRAQASLESFYNQKQAEIKKLEAELEAMDKNIKAEVQAGMLSDAALAERQRALEAKYMEYQQLVYSAEQEMQNMQMNALNSIYDKLTATASRVAKEKGYSLVVDSSAVLFNDPSLDITDQVIAAFGAGK